MDEKQQEMASRIAQIKLRRIEELNNRLRSTLQRDRITASKACLHIVDYSQETPDYLIPYLWKLAPEQNKYQRYQNMKVLRQRSSGGENQAGCCTIV